MRRCALNDCEGRLCCFDCEYMRECSSRCIRKTSENCMRMENDDDRKGIPTEIQGRIQGGAEH